MTKKAVKELREASVVELEKMKADIQVSLRNIRFRSKIERPANPMEKRSLTKKVAVINTLITEKSASSK